MNGLMDIKRLRQDTPGLSINDAGGAEPQALRFYNVHFNNAGCSLPSSQTLEAIQKYLLEESLRGGYEMQYGNEDEIKRLYSGLGILLNCAPGDIAITGSASEAFNKALFAFPFEKGDVILTSEQEYGNNFVNFLELKKTRGIEIRLASINAYGTVDTDSLPNHIDAKVKLIAITQMPTSGGDHNDLAAIGKIAKSAGIAFLVDACQTVGQMPIDVQKIGCDMLAATSRKYLRGPRGLGFLYVSSGILPKLRPTFMDTGSAEWLSADEFRYTPSIEAFESWEKPYALMAGLSEAVAYANALGLDNIWERIKYLSARLRGGLVAIEGIRVLDKMPDAGGIVCFTVEGKKTDEIKKYLASHNINVWVSNLRTGLLDLKRKKSDFAVRASLHYYNTEEETDFFVDKVSEYISSNKNK